MSQVFLLALAGATSLIGYVVGRSVLGLSPRTLAGAAARSLELLGMSMLFLVVNLAVGLFAILSMRTISPWFVSVYLMNDGTLVAISLVQGLVFETWRTSQRAG